MNDTDEDRAAIQPVINQIVVYPLPEFDGEMKTIDWSERPRSSRRSRAAAARPTGWCPRRSSTTSPQVLDMVPPLPGEEALYAQFRWLLDVAAKDPDLKQAIVDEAVEDRAAR